MALASGLSQRDDVDLTLVARRGDEDRWSTAWPRGAAVRGAVPGSRPGRLVVRAGRSRLRAALPRRAGPSRAALHDAGAVAGAVRRHDPRLHVLRPSRVAPPIQGRLLPPRHPPRRPPRRRADLREPGDGRPPAASAARCGRRSSSRRTASTTAGSRPTEPARGCGPRRAGRPGRAAGPAAGGLRRHARAPQGRGAARRRVRPAGRRRTPTRCLVLGGQTGWGMAETERALAAARHPERIVRTGLPARRGGAGPAPPGRGRGLPGARGGVRAARPRGPGLRCPARDDGGDGHGRDGAGARRCWCRRGTSPRWPAHSGRRSEEGRATERRALGITVAGERTWEASVARHVHAYAVAAGGPAVGFRAMRALITGGKGFVGQWLAAHLKDRGRRGRRHRHRDRRRRRRGGAPGHGRRRARGDLPPGRHDTRGRELGRPQPGAAGQRARHGRDPGGRPDVDGSAPRAGRQLGRGVRRRRPRASSRWARTRRRRRPAPTRPASWRRRTVALQAWRGYGQPVIVVRPFNHIGPGQSPNFFVPALAKRIVDARRSGARRCGWAR